MGSVCYGLRCPVADLSKKTFLPDIFHTKPIFMTTNILTKILVISLKPPLKFWWWVSGLVWEVGFGMGADGRFRTHVVEVNKYPY